jgi:hypothetical protein
MQLQTAPKPSWQLWLKNFRSAYLRNGGVPELLNEYCEDLAVKAYGLNERASVIGLFAANVDRFAPAGWYSRQAR